MTSIRINPDKPRPGNPYGHIRYRPTAKKPGPKPKDTIQVKRST